VDQDTGRRPALPSLTGLRALAALGVFGAHINGVLAASSVHTLYRFFAQGTVGVSFFFVLSGFVLTWSRSEVSPRHFYGRRIARIVPNHVLTWGLAVVVLVAVETGALQGGHALASGLLVQAWIPDYHYFFAVNGVEWSLSDEVFFYAIFPLLATWAFVMRPASNRRLLWIVLLAPLALGVVMQLIAPSGNDVPTTTVARWVVYIFPLARSLEFLAGVLLAREMLAGRPVDIGFGRAFALCVAVVLGAAYLPYNLRFIGVTVVPLALVIAAAAAADARGRPTIASARWAQRLGRWSFAFFLVHHLVIRVYLAERPLPTQLPSALGVGALLLVVAVAIAALIHRFWELPLERRLRDRLG
jgi:peptidoglycan/LPS O-acetylase OafA/YrhL